MVAMESPFERARFVSPHVEVGVEADIAVVRVSGNHDEIPP
jgi:hypothetical protein